MATRMQQRRGTALQWTTANPVLNAGEMGWESDTNKFKIGDGTNHWDDLDYFLDAVALGGSIDDYIPLTQKDAASGVPSLDANKNLIVAGSSIIVEGATDNGNETTLVVTDPTADRTITFPDATGTVVLADGSGNVTVSGDLTVSGTTTTINSTTINATTGIVFEGATSNAFETTLTVTDPTADRTVTFQDATGTVVLRDSTDTLTNKSISLGSNTVTSTLAQLNTALSDADVASIAGTETLTNKTLTSPVINTPTGITKSDVGLANVDNTTDANKPISTATQTALDLKAPLANPTFTGTVTVPTPTNSTDATTKAYVDAVTEGLHIHPSVVAATTANVALSNALENGDTLDGITLATGNRILVKNQTTQSENGIYVVAASGQPTRATDFDTAAEVDSGDFVFVSSGTVNGSTGWVQVNQPATIGTDAIAFTQFSGAGTYVAGTGLTLTGNSFSVNHPVASQSGNSGKYLTTDGTNTSWGTISGYSAPTLGSTSIASGATVTTIAGLTLTAPTLTGTVTASGDINLSAANGPGSLIDELNLLMMGAL